MLAPLHIFICWSFLIFLHITSCLLEADSDACSMRPCTKESNLQQPSHPLLLLLLNAYFVLALQPTEGQRKVRTMYCGNRTNTFGRVNVYCIYHRHNEEGQILDLHQCRGNTLNASAVIVASWCYLWGLFVSWYHLGLLQLKVPADVMEFNLFARVIFFLYIMN